MGSELLEHTEMTMFYYPASIEVGLTLAEKGRILSPLEYEKKRLEKLVGSRRKEDREIYGKYAHIYPSEDNNELAFKIAGLRHPIDMRAESLNETITEDLWLKSVRLYGELSPAQDHIERPPSGVIFGIDLPQETQNVLFCPKEIKLKDRLKEVYVRSTFEQEILIRRVLRKYDPIVHLVKK